MKKYHFLLLLAACIQVAVVMPQLSFAQNNKDSVKTAAIQGLISSQDYTFIAQSVTPLSGRLRQLTSDYTLRIAKEIIVAQLPYFGRAYSAPIGSADAGIQFTSKDFEYRSTSKKKGGTDINIKLKDTQDVRQMQLSIFSNGTASLQVISNNRQSISYNGYITSSAKQQ